MRECVKFNNCTQANNFKVFALFEFVFFPHFICMTRHSHDDVTMSIVLQPWISFSFGKISISKRATCKEVKDCRSFHYFEITRARCNKKEKNAKTYTVSVQHSAICMHANFRFFFSSQLWCRWCAALNRSHYTLPSVVCSVRLCHFTCVCMMNMVMIFRKNKLPFSHSVFCPSFSF